ncbi:MAG: hypothetical protein ACOX43_02090 [Bacilli bacterium]
MQPLPEVTSGYRNVVKEGILSSNAGGDLEKLTDNIIAMHLDEADYEYHVEKGKVKLTIKFNEEVTTRAIMVYNSVDIETSFMKIKQITINNKLSAKNIGYNPLYINDYDPEYPEMRPGGAFIIEYDEIATKEITIEIDNDKAFSISEIVVLGR